MDSHGGVVWRASRFGFVTGLAVFAAGLLGAASGVDAEQDGPSTTLRDKLWVWTTPERAVPGEHGAETFANASPAQQAAILGVPNIWLAGAGIPNDQALARRQTESVRQAASVVWEILPDGDKTEYHDTFEYSGRVRQIGELRADFPNLQGVLIDDMTTGAMDNGFSPEQLVKLRRQLSATCPDVDLWGVVYTMNFGRPNLDQYVECLDVINLWVWHGRDLADLEQHVAHCEQKFPDKPIVLGLYLRNYGEGKPMTTEQMELQCETARRLAQAGRIEGIGFLTIDNDPEIVSWTAKWIARVADERLGR